MLVRPVMKRLFFPWKTKEKRLASLARLIIIHHEVVTPCQKSSSRSEVRGPFILSSPGPHKGIHKELVQPNPENVNPAAISGDSLHLHTSHIRLWVEQIQERANPTAELILQIGSRTGGRGWDTTMVARRVWVNGITAVTVYLALFLVVFSRLT